ncbi:hypothetical protein COCSADRAFT_157857 [Bipolaris sorokiniana ND90Pr]|uniref:aldehyde dehydrogenase (NAD(+)) n=1 Tax=Cochliobolus sativus (strain ND90Pr / ATCC 201652) TaxID=665912 RepID=M2SYT3_COCSN|nr:uncharacterized protein COCSADRAFT_157857 [Bipolaris sorokiniana ND90Pr]EMD67480.1 hypothetical protein COCSADRAFT_157857 [Bipolaris sorokiniana ND90Pr]
MVQKGLFINNEYIDSTSTETLSIHSPHDESLVLDGVQVASLADVDTAVAAARAAYEGEWSKWTAKQRMQVMYRFADLIDKHTIDLCAWEAKSMGQPVMITQWMYKIASDYFRYMAGWTDKVPGEQWPEVDGIYKIVEYEPVGVCAGIGAWNGAMMFFALKVAPAVATGCTIVYKGSEKTPIGLIQVGELVKEAGFPPGVINIITGDGKVGAAMASHMDIDKIGFTGSVFAGKKFQELAAQSNLKRVTLELGGKSPSLIFADADMENALQHHSQNFLMNSGQACVAASRTFVQEDIVDDFIAQLKIRFEQLSNIMGHPEQQGIMYGPLADSKQFERVMEFIEIGKKEASLVTGGVRKGTSGFYIEPTIFLNPGDDARIYREEIFGPVISIRTFKTEEEAIRMANDTNYGLSACVFTASTPRALRIAKKIRSGMVNINTSQHAGLEAPMGGSKQSGLGREGGKMGVMSYLEAKTICINMNM